MTTFQPYPEYKDSGLPWLGKVPKHWDMERAKWLYQKMDRPVRATDKVVTCFRDGNVTLRKNRRLDGFTNSLKEIGYQGVRQGDLVIHAMDAFAGAVGVSDSDGKSTPVYSVCTARKKLDNRYYAYLVREMAQSEWIMCLARGIRERSTDFRFQSFGKQIVPLPPHEEQRAIANYLDANAAKVRCFIRNRERLIEVLNEQKQAIINRAVTRGLDPNATLKPSGIRGHDSIPEHWEVKRGKFLFACVDVRSKTGSEELLTVSARDGVVPREGRNVTMFKAASYIGHKLCWPQDLVINSLWAWANGLGFAREHGIVSSAYGVYRLRSQYADHWEFLDWSLRSPAYHVQYTLRSKGIWKSRLQMTDWAFLDMPVALPPRHEADKICEHLSAATRDVDTEMNRAEREIDLIQEYRTRLIADVVTGKVDVRHLAPPPGSEDLEEAVDELESLDDLSACNAQAGAAGELDEEALAGEGEP